MAKRKIIKIDVEKCTGCGDCIPNCPEGAIQMIDGKARLVSDLFCDGLGACIGTCPVDAISIEEREAKDYDEATVMENIITHGPNTIAAHLKHLENHGETEYLNIAKSVLEKKGIALPDNEASKPPASGGCPGMRMMQFDDAPENANTKESDESSQLRQWPIQLHLVPPQAPYFKGADVLLSADCVAYSAGGFHSKFLKGKSLAIACPKLDTNKEIYREKITSLIDEAKIKTLTVMIMEVPCCGGLMYLAQEAIGAAKRKIPIKKMVVGIQGDIKSEEWIEETKD